MKSRTVLCLEPGNLRSGYVHFCPARKRILGFGTAANHEIERYLGSAWASETEVVIEPRPGTHVWVRRFRAAVTASATFELVRTEPVDDARFDTS